MLKPTGVNSNFLGVVNTRDIANDISTTNKSYLPIHFILDRIQAINPDLATLFRNDANSISAINYLSRFSVIILIFIVFFTIYYFMKRHMLYEPLINKKKEDKPIEEQSDSNINQELSVEPKADTELHEEIKVDQPESNVDDQSEKNEENNIKNNENRTDI